MRQTIGWVAVVVLAGLVPLVGAGQDESEGVRLVKQARQARDQGQTQDALALYTRAVAALQKEQGADHEVVGLVFDEQGMVHYHLGQLDRAEPLVRRALAI